jgi:hypothetical protein
MEKDFNPSVYAQGPRKRTRGNKEVAASKIKGRILRCDRLGYFVVMYFSLGGPLSQDGSPDFILIKSS